MKPRPGASLIGLAQAESEFGIPYGTLLALIKSGDLPYVQLPKRRRLYIDRAELEHAIETWKVGTR